MGGVRRGKAKREYERKRRDAASHNPTPKKAEALAAYRKLGTVSAAMQAVGMSRYTWYDWIENDEQFAMDAKDAAEAVADMLEEMAIKRATAEEGSDTLLIFLLKNLRRDRYGEKLQLSASDSLLDAIVGTPRQGAA